MVKVHRAMLERLGPPPVPAVLLDTPFGFQENAGELSQRVVTYFRDSLRAPIEVASSLEEGAAGGGTGRRVGRGWCAGRGGGCREHSGRGRPRGADGRGSRCARRRPVRAGAPRVEGPKCSLSSSPGPGAQRMRLRKWAGTVVPSLLKEKLRHGGGITFSSAAALTLGVSTVPVYEIYKVGEDPHWLTGLDVLGEAGIRAAVIPHYNNAEGGTHDTRFCYLGERRLSMIEPALPEGAFVLGVDEHTAITFDLDNGECTIAGLGVVTIRAAGRSQSVPAGSEMTIKGIIDTAEALVRAPSRRQSTDPHELGRAGSASEFGELDSESVVTGSASGRLDGAGSAGVGDEGAGGSAAGLDSETATAMAGVGNYQDSPLIATVHEQEAAFSSAVGDRDVKGAVAALLELEGQITEWATDIPSGDAMDRARASLRSLVVELGRIAQTGARDPREVIGPFVESMLELRAKARADRRFEDSDMIRDRLEQLGVEVRDTPQGVEWLLEPS